MDWNEKKTFFDLLDMAAWWQTEYKKVWTSPVDSAHSNVNDVIPNLAINDWTQYNMGLKVSGWLKWTLGPSVGGNHWKPFWFHIHKISVGRQKLDSSK